MNFITVLRWPAESPVFPWLLTAFIHACQCAAQQRVSRQTTHGDVVGAVRRTEKGAQAQVFLGVPYAQPPVGELRLKYPVPPIRWSKPHDATFERDWCVQFWYHDDRIEKRSQSEDCLYMNIFVPFLNEKPRPYPILFWIHGGSYQVGGANAFPINGTIDNIVSRGTVAIFINYRLGILGFMSSLNYNLPGNYGLEDQLLALKWVKNNAHLFDGDPNRITIGGESAGAASVSLMGVSPKARGYFNRMIIRSGSSLAPWAVRTINTDLNTDRVISNAGCRQAEGKEGKALLCLQLKDWNEFKVQWRNIAQDDLLLIISKTGHRPIHYNHPFLAHTYFTPVIDGYRLNESFLPHYAEELAKKSPPTPIMLGSTTGECAGYVTWLTYLEKNVGLNLHDLEYVVPSTHYANAEQVKQATYKKYIGDSIWEPNFNFKKALVNIASDQNFVAPMALEAKLYSEKNAAIYMYTFNHGNKELYQRHTIHGLIDVGSSHGFDMVYLFQSSSVVDPGPEKQIDWDEQDLRVTHFLSESVYNFVANGAPNANDSDVAWPAYNKHCRSAIVIDGNGTSLGDLNPGAFDFWISTVGVLQSLTLRHDYRFEPPGGCSGATPHSQSPIDYRVAFYATLCVASLLVACLCCWAFLSAAHRAGKSEMSKALAVSIPLR